MWAFALVLAAIIVGWAIESVDAEKADRTTADRATIWATIWIYIGSGAALAALVWMSL